MPNLLALSPYFEQPFRMAFQKHLSNLFGHLRLELLQSVAQRCSCRVEENHSFRRPSFQSARPPVDRFFNDGNRLAQQRKFVRLDVKVADEQMPGRTGANKRHGESQFGSAASCFHPAAEFVCDSGVMNSHSGFPLSRPDAQPKSLSIAAVMPRYDATRGSNDAVRHAARSQMRPGESPPSRL
jgi:hypothetical protein